MPRRLAPATPADPNVQIIRSGGTRSRKLVEKRVVVAVTQKRKKSAKPAKTTKGKKEKREKAKKGSGKPKNNYLKMIKAAINAYKAHHLHGVSYQYLLRYIGANFTVGPNYRRYVLITLKKAVADSRLEKVGARYKYTKAEWRKDHPKKDGEKPSTGTEKASKPKPKRASEKVSKKSAKPSSAAQEKQSAPKKRAPPTARKQTGASASGSESVWTWQYKDNGGVWRNYFPEASAVVEAVYQDYLKNPGMTDVRSVQSGQWSYLVDFRQMTQQNVQHEAHTTRAIRRYQVPSAEFNDTSKAYK